MARALAGGLFILAKNRNEAPGAHSIALVLFHEVRMTTRSIAIIGAGGHATVVAATLLAAGHKVAGFFDDEPSTWGTRILDIPVLGPLRQIPDSGCTHGIIAVGNNRARKSLAGGIRLEWITAVHPFSWVHPDATLGPGTLVCAGSVVQPGARIGSHVIINTRSSVDHHARVGDYAHLAVAHMAGGASIGEGVFMALGSIVLPKIRVGAWATVGAGAVVTKEVAPETTVVGIPARPLVQKATIALEQASPRI
jgi:sugar O-acyltransferase (sialic acid O-acetyltransferase NeuD family)